MKIAQIDDQRVTKNEQSIAIIGKIGSVRQGGGHVPDIGRDTGSDTGGEIG